VTLAPGVLERESSQRSVVRLATALLYADVQPKKFIVTRLQGTYFPVVNADAQPTSGLCHAAVL